MGSFTRLRQIAALAKIDATVSLVKSILEDEGEPSIVIFTFFVEVGKLMKQRLSSLGWNGELFTGGTSASKRQEMVDNFQVGTLVNYPVCILWSFSSTESTNRSLTKLFYRVESPQYLLQHLVSLLDNKHLCQ